MEKKDIRKLVAERRREQPEKLRMEKSIRICQRIADMDVFARADAVYVYMDCKGEVSTRPLIEECFRLGKKVAAPKVDGDHMAFFLDSLL